MKKTIICFIVFAVGLYSSVLQAQIMTVGAGAEFMIKSGTTVSFDSLELTPSANFSFSNNTLSKSNAVSNSTTFNYINKVYQYSATTAAAYSGALKLFYNNSQLNGRTASGLKLLVNNGTSWSLDNNSSSNTASNVVLNNSLSGVSLREITAADCINPTSGGTIAASQSGSSGFNPAAFTSSVAPTGHNGILEYKWQSSTTSSSAGFSDIASSNSDIYDAGALTQTTWFKRLARVDCSSDWSGAAESNVLQICITPATPSVNVVNNCGTSTLSTTASGTLLWSTTATASSINVNSAGTYTVTQTVNGCISAAGSGVAAPLTIPTTPSVNVVNNCNSTSTLSTTASGTLLWSTNETTTSITVTSAGTYTVTQTANGCTSAAGSGVAAPKTAPTAGITNNTGSTALTCNRTSINVTATGGVSYSWSGGLGSSDAATISSAGTYTVTVTGANSCTSTAAISIVSIPLPDATITANGATTFTYGNSVVLSGPAFVLPSVVESVGNALSLNGTGNYVSIPSGINNNFSGNQITVEGWFYPTQQSFNTTALIGEAYEGDGVVKFVLSSEFESGVQKIKAGFYSPSTTWVQGTSSVNLSFNQWSHIAATYDQANIKIYVNGSLTCTYANTNALPNGSERWLLGRKWDTGNSFPGKMDEIRIWNVARTQAQIQTSMNSTISPTTSGLVGYYKLDESSGTTANDATGHGYTGTVN